MVAVAARESSVTNHALRDTQSFAICKRQIARRLRQIATQFENPLRDACKHHLRGIGKLLRGQLAARAATAAGADQDKALAWAVSVELLHNATLVHDDICDSDDTRRGRASVAHLFGPQVALCLGDALISESYTAARCYTNRRETLDSMGAAITELAQGQASEFARDCYPSVDSYLEIAVKKTAPLFRLPVCGTFTRLDGSPRADTTKSYLDTCAIAFQAMNDLSNFDSQRNHHEPSSDFLQLRPNIAIAIFANSLDPVTRKDFDDMYRALAKPTNRGLANSRLMEQFWNMFAGSFALGSALEFAMRKVEAADQLYSGLDKDMADVVSPLHSWLLASSARTTLIH